MRVDWNTYLTAPNHHIWGTEIDSDKLNWLQALALQTSNLDLNLILDVGSQIVMHASWLGWAGQHWCLLLLPPLLLLHRQIKWETTAYWRNFEQKEKEKQTSGQTSLLNYMVITDSTPTNNPGSKNNCLNIETERIETKPLFYPVIPRFFLLAHWCYAYQLIIAVVSCHYLLLSNNTPSFFFFFFELCLRRRPSTK